MTNESSNDPYAPPPPASTPPPPAFTPPPESVPATELASDSKLFAFLAYFLGLIGVLIVILAKKEDKFAMYHAKQALVLLIVSIAASVVNVIPVLGQIVSGLVFLAVFIFWIMGIINALGGQQKELPFIGKYAEKFNF